MHLLKGSAFICAAKRTPFGAFGGAFKGLSATGLGVKAATAVIDSIGLEPDLVDPDCAHSVPKLWSNDGA